MCDHIVENPTYKQRNPASFQKSWVSHDLIRVYVYNFIIKTKIRCAKYSRKAMRFWHIFCQKFRSCIPCLFYIYDIVLLLLRGEGWGVGWGVLYLALCHRYGTGTPQSRIIRCQRFVFFTRRFTNIDTYIKLPSHLKEWQIHWYQKQTMRTFLGGIMFVLSSILNEQAPTRSDNIIP